MRIGVMGVGCLVLLLTVGAMGAHPRFLEELRIGGGYGDTVDGGADFSKDGALSVDGDLVVGGHAAAPRSVSIIAGAGQTTRLGLHETDALHGGAVWHDGGADALRLGLYADGTPQPLLELNASPAAHVFGALDVDGEVSAGRGVSGLATEKLLTLWRFESPVSCIDWTMAGIPLTAGGSGLASGDGKFGSCVVFGGVGWMTGSAAIPASRGAQDLSMSVWVNTTSSMGDMGIMGWRNSGGAVCCSLYLDAGRPAFRVKGVGGDIILTGTTGIADGRWHHLAVTRDYASTLALYCDGTAVASGADTAGSAIVSVSFCVGALGVGVSPFNGRVDEASVWDRVLSAADVRAMGALRGELESLHAGRYLPGNLTVNGDAVIKGGDFDTGEDGVRRGVVTCWDGGGLASPGCIRLYSTNGSAWHLYVEDDGTVRVSAPFPVGNNDGVIVGTQN